MAPRSDTVYIRNDNGECRQMPLNAGVTEWLSDGGYRITFYLPDCEVTIRRDPDQSPIQRDMLGDFVIKDCRVSIR